MFFLFGSPRSGTTFLKEALCANPEIAIPHETDFIVPMAFILDRIKDEKAGKRLIMEIVISSNDYLPSIGQYLSSSEIKDAIEASDYTVASILNTIYAAIAHKSGTRIAGDKSPNDLGFLGILAKTGIFSSNIKIIHLVRDMRDVILSLKQTNWAPTGIDQYFPGIWSVSNRNLKRFASNNPSNYILVRYEDLVFNPEKHFRDICSCIGVEYSASMLNWESMGTDLKTLPHHSNLGKPPQTDRCFAWKRSDDTHLLKWSTQAKEALEEFGYET